MDTIVQIGDAVLRSGAAEVPVADIRSPRIQDVVKRMETVLAQERDGAALAAPQIGVSLRIFVLSRRVFSSDSEHEAASKDPHFVYINPVIVKRSRQKRTMDEGCLSVRGTYGSIVRHANITIRAYDEHGCVFTRGAGGLLAQAFQHECDHLEGVLFIDKAKETWDVSESDNES